MTKTTPIRRVLRDILDLFELQIQLFSVDAQAAQRKATRAAALSITALALGGATLTVFIMALGFVLHELSGLSTGASLLIVSVLMFAIVGGLLALAASAVGKVGEALGQSQSEMAENFRWLKATLVAPESSPRNVFRDESFPRHKEPPTDFDPRYHDVDSSYVTTTSPTPGDEPFPVDPTTTTPLHRR
ncbi:phage holin family protein [Crateriforma conspicua]|uniref:Phage holin family protein n=1 Tax=Crateriforma conspicua TaxID=2527996 RepID=A0A5C6FW31_9PLAN|nr:phage holin family protein [Crateriforma conspicua]TWU67129.1 hypothetical protein V7x_27020 [Crateriforma conspicua]